MITIENSDVNKHTVRCSSCLSLVLQCGLVSAKGYRNRSAPPCSFIWIPKDFTYFLFPVLSNMLPCPTASESMTLWHNTNMLIIIIIIVTSSFKLEVIFVHEELLFCIEK